MRKCKLSDCVKEINDRTTENNQHEVLTSSKSGIFSQEEYFDKQVASKDNTGYKIIRRGQFTYRSMSDSGTFTINRLENKEIGIVSPAYPVFEAKNIDAEFLKYYFKSELFNKAIINLSQGSTRKALKFKDLVDIEIYLPEIEEQKKIVKILKNNDHVIEKYNELIKEKEQFIKSQFVEMFGNPITNNKNWKKIKGEKLFVFSSGKGNPTKNLNDNNEFPCYGGNGITGYSKDYLIDYDTIVIGRVGAYCGSVHRTINKVWITDNAIYIKKFKAVFNLKFLEQLLLKINIHNFANATGQPKITQEPLENFEYIQPPIELQNKFEKIVQLIDKQKFELEKQKQNYIDLKKGLMQQLLTGKLKVS